MGWTLRFPKSSISFSVSLSLPIGQDVTLSYCSSICLRAAMPHHDDGPSLKL